LALEQFDDGLFALRLGEFLGRGHRLLATIFSASGMRSSVARFSES
jgi:hypothetical protein